MDKQQVALLQEMIDHQRFDYLLLGSVMNYGLKIWRKLINRKRFEDVLEINDGYVIVYRSYGIVLHEFIKYKLDPCLFLTKLGAKIWQLGANYIRSFQTNCHKVLNGEKAEGNNIIPEHMLEIQEHNDDGDMYQYYSSFCENEMQSKIFYLKSMGYTNEEVARSLKIPRKKVEYNVYVIRKKYQSYNIYI